MSENSLPFDNTASFKGSIYQLYFALQKCFEMEPGQKVFIETYGDVTLSGSEQFELKFYQGNLTDSDCNFWNTLKNWMHKDFDETKYSALILCTTHIYGDNTKFTEWNNANTDQRFGILAEILKDSEIRAKQKQACKSNSVISESLKLQRIAMETSKKTKLMSVLERLIITCNAPSMTELYNKIKAIHCNHIPLAKSEDYWNALLGYLIHPKAVNQLYWVITYEAFTAKIQELTSTYCLATKVFPQKFFSEEFSPEDSSIAAYENHLFVNKIEHIEYNEVISEAIDNYIRASLTVLEEFDKYEVTPARHRAYAKEVLDSFQPKYRIAQRSVSDVICDSKNLYDIVTGEPSPDFQGFDTPSRTFRNGVLHMQMDDTKKGIKWRLEKDHE